jgi:hypothetical protein
MALAIFATLVGAGCNDDGVRTTGSASASIGSDGADSSESGVTLTTADTSTGASTGTSNADTSGSTGSTGTTDGTTTSSETDSTTGEPASPGQSQAQLVNVGQRMSSANYQMVFTLGQPSQLQSTHNSANYRLHGGLVGANGSPP